MGYMQLLTPNIETRTLYQNDDAIPTFNIVTEQARYPLRNLADIFENHEITPDYQRNDVWDDKRKSKLIESFIINIPVPPIFLYETENARYEVMDGKQRVSTILDFYNDKFKLTDLEMWSKINGCTYSDLDSEIKKMIDRRYLSATILLSESAQDIQEQTTLKQIVFERLNTGGLKLSPQEIRNALYQCKFNDMLIEVANSNLFLKMIPMGDDLRKRMDNCELVLRYFAYRSACYYDISKGTKIILDQFSRSACNLDEDEVMAMKDEYIDLLKKIDGTFGNRAFFRKETGGAYEKMIYDTIMLSCKVFLEQEYTLPKRKDIVEVNRSKMQFIENHKADFNGRYTAIRNVSKRIDLFLQDFLVELYGR